MIYIESPVPGSPVHEKFISTVLIQPQHILPSPRSWDLEGKVMQKKNFGVWQIGSCILILSLYLCDFRHVINLPESDSSLGKKQNRSCMDKITWFPYLKQNPNKLSLVKNLACLYTGQSSRDIYWALTKVRSWQRCMGARWLGAKQHGMSHQTWGTSLDCEATSQGAVQAGGRKSPEFKMFFEGFLSLLAHLKVKVIACPTWNPHFDCQCNLA